MAPSLSKLALYQGFVLSREPIDASGRRLLLIRMRDSLKRYLAYSYSHVRGVLAGDSVAEKVDGERAITAYFVARAPVGSSNPSALTMRTSDFKLVGYVDALSDENVRDRKELGEVDTDKATIGIF